MQITKFCLYLNSSPLYRTILSSFIPRRDRRGGLVVETSPRYREVVGSTHGCNRPKSFKLVVVAFPLGVQDYDPPVSG